MSSEKTRAFVIRVVEFSETSCVVTLFTEDFGKIGALAKGARRPKGPFESAIDLLALCRIVFLHKSSDTLDLLTEAKLERRFRVASRSLAHLYAGYYVAELLNELTDKGDPHPLLFGEAERILQYLEDEKDVATAVLRFELTALRVLGHLPSWDQCAGCGQPLEVRVEGGRLSEGEGTEPVVGSAFGTEPLQRRGPDERVSFGQLAGGVLCPRCRPGQRQVVGIRRPTLAILNQFSQESFTWTQATLPATVRGELRGIMNHYLANLLGKRPRMHQYLGMLAT